MIFLQTIVQKLAQLFLWMVKSIGQIIGKIAIACFSLLGQLIAFLKWIFPQLKLGLEWASKCFYFCAKYLLEHRLVIIVCLLLVGFGTLTLAAILPNLHNFEGNLIVEELSFTYEGTQPKEFINRISKISSIESEGKQTLTFTGKFQSETLPEINQLQELKIVSNQWAIAPANPKINSDIDLTELSLQPQAQVSSLSYDFIRHQLIFSVQSESKPNLLKIYLGNQPLKIALGEYQLPDLNLPNDDSRLKNLEFVLTPKNKQFKLDILQPTKFYITTQNLPKNSFKNWFGNRIEVQDIKLSRSDPNINKFTENLQISTIVEGKIRMAEQEKEMKPNQFLIIEKPGIKLLRHTEVIPEKGIEIRFSGITKSLEIGLDHGFPVTQIKASWLDSLLPRDAIIALISFSAATFSYLLNWLIEHAARSSHKP